MYASIISRTLEGGADQKREKGHANDDLKSRAKSRDPVKRDPEFLFSCKIMRKNNFFFARCVEWFHILKHSDTRDS